jgi:hypothetical protein
MTILILHPKGKPPVQVRCESIASKRRQIVKRKVGTAANMLDDGKTMPEVRTALGIRRAGK